MTSAEWAPEAKRKVIVAAEERMDYFLKQIQERPKLRGLWLYWFHWYRVRRADWYTRLWLEQLQAYAAALQKWENESTLNKHMREIERIIKNIDAIEDSMEVIKTELQDSLELAREKEWKIRYPRPYRTMEQWISAIHDRYREIIEWIRRVRGVLPKVWINFVYVIYYAYTSPGAERHLEAHFEGECFRNKEVQAIVKKLANKILRQWVAAPRIVGGEVRPGYAVPLLQREMSKPPYEGKKHSGQNLWQWGIQWESAINYYVADYRVVEAPSSGEPQAKIEQTLRLELFDYDYAQLRKYNEYNVPAEWWKFSLEQLREMLDLTEEEAT